MSVLSSLARAYERLPKKPAFGYAEQGIKFLLTLTPDGKMAFPPQAWEADSKGKVLSRVFSVPYFGGRSGRSAPPYFLWDNSAYVLGISGKVGFDPVKRFEPPRVYRRVSGSMIRLLFRRRSSLHRRPPLLRAA